MAKYKCSVCGAPAEKEQCWKHSPKKPLAKTRGFKHTKKTRKSNYDSERMWELFKTVWDKRGPYSEIDNTYLGREVKSVFMDHLLPKESFPEVMYEEWNIFIVSWEQHDQRHFGIPHPKHQEAINKAKEIHNNLFSNC